MASFSAMNSDSVQILPWTVPDTTSESALVRVAVIDYDGNRAVDVSDGYFKIIRQSAVADRKKEALPSQFELRQNYPNPFNNATLISFQLPSKDYIVLNIYDFSGRLVTTLFQGVVQAGKHELRWQAMDNSGVALASGVYFYQLKTKSGYRACKKLILLK